MKGGCSPINRRKLIRPTASLNRAPRSRASVTDTMIGRPTNAIRGTVQGHLVHGLDWPVLGVQGCTGSKVKASPLSRHQGEFSGPDRAVRDQGLRGRHQRAARDRSALPRTCPRADVPLQRTARACAAILNNPDIAGEPYLARRRHSARPHLRGAAGPSPYRRVSRSLPYIIRCSLAPRCRPRGAVGRLVDGTELHKQAGGLALPGPSGASRLLLRSVASRQVDHCVNALRPASPRSPARPLRPNQLEIAMPGSGDRGRHPTVSHVAQVWHLAPRC